MSRRMPMRAVCGGSPAVSMACQSLARAGPRPPWARMQGRRTEVPQRTRCYRPFAPSYPLFLSQTQGHRVYHRTIGADAPVMSRCRETEMPGTAGPPNTTEDEMELIRLDRTLMVSCLSLLAVACSVQTAPEVVGTTSQQLSAAQLPVEPDHQGLASTESDLQERRRGAKDLEPPRLATPEEVAGLKSKLRAQRIANGVSTEPRSPNGL
jgi:hypothetical protein